MDKSKVKSGFYNIYEDSEGYFLSDNPYDSVIEAFNNKDDLENYVCTAKISIIKNIEDIRYQREPLKRKRTNPENVNPYKIRKS